MDVIINTGRTIWQGQAIESGKDLKMYIDAAAICEMTKEDMKAIGVEAGDNVKVTTDYGEVVVTVVEAKQLPPVGMVYIPMGPWANKVVRNNTDSTATPSFKGTPGKIAPTDDEVLDMPTLMKTYGKV